MRNLRYKNDELEVEEEQDNEEEWGL